MLDETTQDPSDCNKKRISYCIFMSIEKLSFSDVKINLNKSRKPQPLSNKAMFHQKAVEKPYITCGKFSGKTYYNF